MWESLNPGMVSWRVPPRLRGVRKGPNRYPGVVDLAFEGREVLLFERFLSWDECDHIMATAGLDAGDTGEGGRVPAGVRTVAV